ncbi:MAG TPA: c-type cytochrome [Pinirhizobacter sp.]|uniref:c-type cytochrome n=1 Tax=Pinirhizobacter sp. TaxID=2950432 RepID=UPI002C66A1EC|nr:c-type cytochrome [Pinirhizobacter sp.]HMH66567.1 c-type cytochrome [Pinirhizobacter sp.]
MRNLVLAAAMLAAPVMTQGAVPVKPARLGLCAACHGVDGMATMAGAPNLAGQREDYLRQALRQYRDGRRDVAVMRAALGPLSEAELDQLATWYAAQSPQRQANP